MARRNYTSRGWLNVETMRRAFCECRQRVARKRGGSAARGTISGPTARALRNGCAHDRRVKCDGSVELRRPVDRIASRRCGAITF
eukprot:6341825-Pyramimonas_sp.AAC.1